MHNWWEFVAETYRQLDSEEKITYLEFIGHGETCGSSDMGNNDGEDRLEAYLAQWSTEDATVYFNGCDTVSLARYMSTTSTNRVFYGNSYAVEPLIINYWITVPATWNGKGKKGFKAAEELK